MIDFLLLGGFFLFVLIGVVLAGLAYGFRPETQSGESALAEPELPGPRAFFAHAFQRVGESVPAAKASVDPVRKLLMSAGYRYPSAVQIFYGIQYAATLLFGALAVLVAVLNAANFFFGLIGVCSSAGFGFFLPEFVLKRRTAARRKRIRRGIPPALDLLVLSIEAGQALNQAVVDTSTELRLGYPDLSAELWQVHLELRAGQSRAEAFRQLGARNGDPELKKLSNLLVDSERFGTSLGPALRTHAKYLRTRMRQQAQETARKVTVKLIFPVFFLIFPSVLLVTLGPAVLHMMKSFAGFTSS
jgi:tight adherence protein C